MSTSGRPDKPINEPKPPSHIDRVGVLVQEPDGRVWIAQPTGGYGRRNHTLPGGGVEHGLSNQQNALKEVWEETGLHVEITGHLGDFRDSNNGDTGRLYIGKRVGGQPWDAKIEPKLTAMYGKPSAESEAVKLVTPEKAAELLHRTDDLAQLAMVHPIKLDTKTGSEVMKKVVEGIQPAAQQWKKEQEKAGNSRMGNQELHVVQELRGFNRKPNVVNKTDMDALLKQGNHIEVLRAVRAGNGKSGEEIAEEFRSGENYPGHGIFGSGTYSDSRKGANNVAASGSYGGSVLRIAIPKDAKIIKSSELRRVAPTAPGAFSGYQNPGGKNANQCWLGVHAALAGYDAIKVDTGAPGENHYYVILNRSKVTVQKEDAAGHTIS